MNRKSYDTIVRLKKLQEITGLGRTSIYNYSKRDSPYFDPTFPKPVKLGSRAVGWLASEVFLWVASRASAA